MSQDQQNPGRPSEGSGRSRRRRRGRGGRGGAGAPPNPTAAQAKPPQRTQPAAGAGRSGRGSGRGGGGGRRPGQPDAARQARELEITDEKIFQRLKETGLDLGQEAIVEAYLYFAGEGAARRVAGRLESDGYVTYVDPSPPGRWVVEAVTRAVPTPEHIATMGSALKAAAGSAGGLYDGWWAFEVPDEEEPAVLVEPEPTPEPV